MFTFLPVTERRNCAVLALVTVVALALSGCGGKHTFVPSGLFGHITATSEPRIAPNVSIGGISVGGMTQAVASNTLKVAINAEFGKIAFQLHDPVAGGTFHYTLSDFKGYFDVDGAVKNALTALPGAQIGLPLKLDPAAVSLHVSRIADEWRVPMMEPKVKFGAGGARTVSVGHAGREVDTEAAVSDVMANLPSLSRPLVTDNVPFTISQPQVNPNRVLGLADTLVSFTTTFNPANATRTNNLLLAVHNINGTVVGPGEVFSYNDSVGPRTQQTGFQDAIIYVNNRMKKDVGGGICQASSTLYNCVLFANMPIVERHAHSLPVHYVPAGRDATVAWGGDDFRFRNNTSKPIIVRAVATSGGTLTESLIGDRSALPHPGAKVAIAVSPKRTYPDGFAVTSYRIVSEDGVQIAKEPLGVSFYHVLVGGVPH